MQETSPPEEVRPDQPQPEPEGTGPAQEPSVPVPTHFRRNLWLLAIVLGVVIAAWVLALLWKRVPEDVSALQQAPLPPVTAPAAQPSPGPAASLPEPMPVAPSRIVGTSTEVIPAAPPISLTPGSPAYRLGRFFDVTKRIPGFQIAQLIRLPERWADQREVIEPKPPAPGGQPPFVPAKEAAFLRPQERVAVFSVGPESHAYPVTTFVVFGGIYDTVGDRRVFICWNPATQAARCFVPNVEGREVKWQDGGLLYRGNQVYYDAETGSLWDSFSGQAVCGPLAGLIAPSLPLVVWPWDKWKAEHPDALVFAASLPPGTPERAEIERAIQEYVASPYLPIPPAQFKATAGRLPAKAFVLGVSANGKAKAYPLAALAASGAEVVRDEVGGRQIEVHVTSPRTAYAMSAGDILDAPVMLWFGWLGCEPGTDLYEVQGTAVRVSPETSVAPAP